MNLVIIKYNAGNIRSVSYALERLSITATLSDDPAIIQAADKVIFPGVGEASSTMKYLKNTGLDELIPTLKQPVLGICLGLQLMCAWSEEGDTPCLGIFDNQVHKFPPGNEKVPHMGWNLLQTTEGPLLKGLGENPYVYFVHSYFAEPNEYTIGKAEYILPFSAALHKDNFYATQFHPEKSGTVGAKILENFLSI